MSRRLSSALLASIGVAVAVVLLVALLPRPKRGELVVYAAVSLRGVLEEAASQYERSSGLSVERVYGNSQSVLSGLVLGEVDVFLPADDSYVADARERRLVEEETSLATMTAVVVLRPGVSEYSDRLTLVQANPDVAAIGRRTREVLRKRGQWDALAARTKANLGTVTDVATAVKLGTADAGIVWDAVATQFPDLTVAHPPELEGVTASVAAAVVVRSRRKDDGRAFIRHLATSAELFRRYGFGGVAR